MILAAGRGKRLSPITDTIPKPLLPVAGKPLVVHLIERLVQAGITDIVINVSYLAKIMIDTLGDGSTFGAAIEYSLEEVEGGLETGGGVIQALPLLGEDPFLVISGDLFTDYPFEKLPKQFDGLAHLIMVDNPDFHSCGDYYFSGTHLVEESAVRLTYASMGVFKPELFKNINIKKIKLAYVIEPEISEGNISAEHFHGEWFNIGTSEQLQEVQQYVTKPVEVLG